jgi:ribonuclease HIII
MSSRDLLHFERMLWQQGVLHVAGVDEAGRGPLAGPVVAAAVIFPPELIIPGVDDSKVLTPVSAVRIMKRSIRSTSSSPPTAPCTERWPPWGCRRSTC